MTAPYRLGVQQFIGHFREQGSAIAEVASELHRKILYCSALDPLARAVCAPKTKNRPRFVNLLLNHTDWQDAGRISLFQLACHLRLTKRTRFRLYREVKRRLEASPPRRRMPLSSSPTLAEMSAFATAGELEALQSHSYAELFYTFRNNLIHEYRQPGYGTDWSRKATEPFYTSLSSFGERELVFPIAFVESLYEQALQHVSQHLLTNKINPHTRFNFGSHWRSSK